MSSLDGKHLRSVARGQLGTGSCRQRTGCQCLALPQQWRVGQERNMTLSTWPQQVQKAPKGPGR